MNTSRLQVMGGSHPGDSELFSWPSANLFLDEGTNHCSLLESGPFSLFLTAHSRCRLLTFVEAAVGALRWPVGKDSLVTILHSPCPPSASFLFAFPANEDREKLVYKLHLLPRLPPLSHDGSDILRLHALLQLYASAQMEPEDSGPPLSTMTCLERDAQEYWSKIGADGRPNQNSAKHDHGTYSSRAECEDTMQTRNHAAAATAVRGSDSMCGKRMMKKIQKARRVSAVSKLLSKAIASGIISGNAHVQVKEPASYSVCSAGALPPPILAAKDEAEKAVRQAVAKVEAVTKIVEAVDKRTTAASHRGGKNDEQRRNCSDHEKAVINDENQAKAIATLADWTLNEAGLQLLLNLVIAASYCKREALLLQTPSNLSTITSLHTGGAPSCATTSASTALRRHRPPLPRTPSNRSQLSSQASSPTHAVTSSP